MCSNDLNISLDKNTFPVMIDQFNRVLADVFGNMQMMRVDDATITLKLDISVEKSARSTPNGVVDMLIPRFKHAISSVMQVKDKVSGELVGDYQLVWDEEEEKFVMRKIDNGQTSIFDQDDEPVGKFVDKDYKGEAQDADYTEIPALPEGQRGLPAPAESAEDGSEPEEPDDTPESAETELDAADESESASEESKTKKTDRYDERTPFGWLAQFVGEEMRVTEAMGNYTVRTATGNKVVLSSATDPSNPFFCDKAKLANHVQHKLICAGYGEEELAVISILCGDCGEALFTLIAPDATEEEVSKAMNTDSSDESDGEDGEGYDYDPPEE